MLFVSSTKFIRRYEFVACIRALTFAGALFLSVFHATVIGAEEVIPLVKVHAHNDYLHPRPLLDALECGFCSFEADIHLVKGELLVAHDLFMTRPGQTLTTLYLEPLRQRIKANGGRVYRNGPTVWLLIDMKGGGNAMYPVLRKVLTEYSDILNVFKQDADADGKAAQTELKAVTAVLTGGRPAAAIAAEKLRYWTTDGHLDDLAIVPRIAPNLMPWISTDWRMTFDWTAKGDAPIPEDERKKLRELVEKAHAQGRLIRFWGAPDNRAAWAELLAAGVDLLNTDDLKGCRDFMLEKKLAK